MTIITPFILISFDLITKSSPLVGSDTPAAFNVDSNENYRSKRRELPQGMKIKAAEYDHFYEGFK